MAAKRKSLEIVDVDPDGGERSLIIDGFENVPDREPGVMLEGEVDEQIRSSVSRLRSEARASERVCRSKSPGKQFPNHMSVVLAFVAVQDGEVKRSSLETLTPRRERREEARTADSRPSL
jgi:hypothetical protein